MPCACGRCRDEDRPGPAVPDDERRRELMADYAAFMAERARLAERVGYDPYRTALRSMWDGAARATYLDGRWVEDVPVREEYL